MSEKKLSANEYIKTRSNYLRGTIVEGLADLSTGSMTEDDQQLLKFHGTYQQDDRDLRADRAEQLRDDGRDTTEVAGAVGPFEELGECSGLDVGLEVGRVHRGGRRGVHGVHAHAAAQLEVLVHR